MGQIEHYGIVTDASKYIANYRDVTRFLNECKQCPCYGKLWSCPPFDDDIDSKLAQFKSVFLLATKIYYDDATRRAWAKNTNVIDHVMQPIFDSSWTMLTRFFGNLEKHYPGSRAFTLRCRYCATCSRLEGKPCRYPQLMRCSLESWGFDIGKTTSELLGIDLKWSINGKLPDSMTLVTALFSPSDLPEGNELMASLNKTRSLGAE